MEGAGSLLTPDTPLLEPAEGRRRGGVLSLKEEGKRGGDYFHLKKKGPIGGDIVTKRRRRYIVTRRRSE